jgi:hypothetical protein
MKEVELGNQELTSEEPLREIKKLMAVIKLISVTVKK